LRQGGCDPRHGYRVRHHGADRRRSEGPAEGLRPAVRGLRRGDEGEQVWKTAGRTRRVPEVRNRMAKTSQVNRNGNRERMAKRDKAKRAALKAIVMDRSLPVEDRFTASLKLA